MEDEARLFRWSLASSDRTKRLSGVRAFARRALGPWLVCFSLVAITLPALTTLFGAQQLNGRGGVAEAALPDVETRLDAASQLVVSRLGWALSELRLVGATNTVATYLRESTLAARLAVTHDLYAFVVTTEGCQRIVLAPVASEVVVADRQMERPACGHLLTTAANLPGGQILLERATTSDAVPRLCIGMSLTAGPGARAGLVAEYDPNVLFADLTALFPAESVPLLHDSRGLSVITSPAEVTPLASRTFLLPAWQGPSGGRWDIALARRSDPGADSHRELPVAPLLLAASALTVVSVYALRKRREQLAQTKPDCGV